SLRKVRQKADSARLREASLAAVAYRQMISLADLHLRAGQPGKAAEVLRASPSEARHWEWGYLSGKTQGERVTILHSATVLGLAYSPDGKRLATGARDGTVRIADAATGKFLLRLDGHQGAVECVAFSPNGKRLASGGTEILVWDAESG